MINRILKIINNKFSRFFKFVFLIRHLFIIFFVAIIFILLIPQYFDFKKNEDIIKNYLEGNYGLEIESFENIKYKFFPAPHLKLINLKGNFNSKETKFISKNVSIFPNLLSIYNFDNFHLNKIKFKTSNLKIELKRLQNLSKFILRSEKKMNFENLNIQIIDNKNYVLDLKNINFFNYGFKKNLVSGEVFQKKFRVKFKEDFTQIKFKLLDTGVSAKLNTSENSKDLKSNGIISGKILNSNFKLFYSLDEDKINVKNFFFREKQLSFDSYGSVVFKPYFQSNLSTTINEININILKSLDVNSLSKFKDILKKFNSENNFFFRPKKFKKNIIDNVNLKTNLVYGRLEMSKSIKIDDSNVICLSNINLLEEYPILYFNCSINSPDKRKLLKEIEIDQRSKSDNFKLNTKGNLNILSKKINFESLEINNNYKATEEDLIYFKSKFENILFDKSFLEIFELSKIKNFILEIS